MIKPFYQHIEKNWFKLPQKIRFLLVGAFNTVFAFLLFIFLFDIIHLNYTIAVLLQYIIGVNLSIITMRYYVFSPSAENFKKEYLKAWVAYLFLLLLNLVWLKISTDYLTIYPTWGQLFYIITTTIITYLIHKYFSFSNHRHK